MSDQGREWKKAWAEAHDELRACLQKEVSLMREILANMHEEELALLLNEKSTWNQVMQDRFVLIEKLRMHREERMQATKQIVKLLAGKEKIAEIPIEKVLPLEEEISCEILSLRDQLMALAEKMNFQNGRNEALFDRPPPPPGTPLPPRPLPSPQKARKTSIATYPRNE